MYISHPDLFSVYVGFVLTHAVLSENKKSPLNILCDFKTCKKRYEEGLEFHSRFFSLFEAIRLFVFVNKMNKPTALFVYPFVYDLTNRRFL